MSLNYCSFKIMPAQRFLLGVLLVLLVTTSTLAQNTVSGVVTEDGTGEPLIGVTVQILGTTSGTITDYEGKYSLSVPDESSTLIFSYVGFLDQEIVVGSQSAIDIVLKLDVESLEEIIVVGYGTQKKSDVMGSIATVKAKELATIVAGNPTNALQGRLAGVQVESFGGQPGGDANVFVRGVSSLTNSYPLYVVDGTFTDNMNFINPRDIESIQVLKDASSAAIYGSRAANGVVIITTKRGDISDQLGKPTVNVNARVGFETASKYLDYLSGSEFVRYRNQLEQNDNTGFVLPDNGVNTDWQDLSLNTGMVEDYGVSISGGGPNSSYYVSGNYFNQEGILVGSGFERINTRLNSQFKFGKFKVNQSLGLTRSELQENNWFGFEGMTAPILRENVPENEGGFEAPNFDDHNFGGINAYALANLEDNLLTTTNALGNVNVSYDILDGLVAKLNFGIDYTSTDAFTWWPTFFMSASDPVRNVNTQNDLSQVRTEALTKLLEPTLSYQKDFGKHNINTVVGMTRQRTDISSLGVYAQGLPNNQTQVIGAATPDNVQNLTGADIVSGLQSYFGRINYSFDGKYLFGFTIRQDESSRFAKKYRKGSFPSFSAGWRISDEAFFPANDVLTDVKLRGGFGELGSQNIPDYAFQSVFNLNSNTSFGGTTVSGYAQTTIALEDITWERAKTFNIGADLGFWDDKLTVGIDYFNKDVDNVLVGVNLPSTSGVSEPVVQNAGKINNKGFELEATFRRNEGDFNYTLSANIARITNEVIDLPNPILGPSTNEDLVRVNRFIEGEEMGVYYGYEILGVYADQQAIDNDANIANDATRQSLVQPGDFIRKDITGDGIVDANDQKVLGSPVPDFTYGINFSGSYKNFDFSVFFQGVQGNEIYNLNRFFNIFWADDNKLTDVLNAWTPENPNTNIPRSTTLDKAQNRAPSSFFVEDGSYLRLKILELGYRFTGEEIGVAWMQNLRLFFAAQNFFVISSYSGYDPEVSSTNGGRGNIDAGFFGNRPDVNPLLGRGLDSRAYPNARTFTFGAQFKF